MSLRRRVMGQSGGSNPDGFKSALITVAQDYATGTITQETFRSVFLDAIGTKFCSFALVSLPDGYVVADKEFIVYGGANIPAFKCITNNGTSFFDVPNSGFAYCYTYHVSAAKGISAVGTTVVNTAKMVAGSVYKVWGWDE